MTNFCSDNTAGVSPAIMAALAGANQADAMPYGADPWTTRLTRRLEEIFACPVAAFPIATGSAANAMALSTLVPSYGSILCHRTAHIEMDECGAPELMTGGAKLALIDGDDGRIDAAALAARLAASGIGVVHHVQPAAVSLTQATETGTVYQPDHLRALSDVAHGRGLPVHMDGARFANAVARLGCTPAEASWRAGIDVLSLGATKNGAMAAEVVLFFNPDTPALPTLTAAVAQAGFRRKRGGHLMSKMRFLSVQLDAWLADDLWLHNARHANAQADRLAAGLRALPGVALRHPVDANMVFADLPIALSTALRQAGFAFYVLAETATTHTVRLVVSFDMPAATIDRLLQVAATAADPAGATG